EPTEPTEPAEPLPPPVVAGPRDCRSSADNDLDGVPDDTLDDVCQCVPDTVEDCDEHPGQDGFGSCRAGTRTCVPSAGYRSSNWSACTGSVGPGARNCTSALDNDCDGLPDNSPDEVCECQPGAVRNCGDLPITGSGSEQFEGCGTGTSVCNAGPGNRSSSWSECTCAAGEYCLTPDGTCSSPQLGVCTVIPTGGCTREFNPMCGCDGQTYSNPCAARSSGVSVDFAGQCAAAEPPLEALP
ncbi:MAG TPA: Kazal-type serine protease inhibitor domain-containing protein, partial [Polyangiaceae bacterium]|nr:Kazal-type serine protease inhibitor domain-containing protein [Polyangiaceae bacterium]